MAPDIGLGSVSYPQTGENRERSRLVTELCQYIGGESNSDDQVRAAYSLDEAVRSFNETIWRFNRVTESITLAASTSTYTLTALTWRAPLRAVIVDSNSKDVETLLDGKRARLLHRQERPRDGADHVRPAARGDPDVPHRAS